MWKQTIWREVTHLLYLALCCSTEPVGKLCDDGGDKWRRDARHKWTGSTGLERCRWLVISVSPSSAPRISCCVIKTDANCVFFLCVCGCVCVHTCVHSVGGGWSSSFFSLLFPSLRYLISKTSLTVSCWIPWPSTQHRAQRYRGPAREIWKYPKSWREVMCEEKAGREEEGWGGERMRR